MSLNYQCQSVKNKKEINTQCPYSAQEGSFYCGVHGKMKNILHFVLPTVIENDNTFVLMEDETDNKNEIEETKNTNLTMIKKNGSSSKKIFKKKSLLEEIDDDLEKSQEDVDLFLSYRHQRLNLKLKNSNYEDVPDPDVFMNYSNEILNEKKEELFRIFQKYDKCPSNWSRKFMEKCILPFILPIMFKKETGDIEMKNVHKLTSNKFYEYIQPFVLLFLDYFSKIDLIIKIQRFYRHKLKKNKEKCFNQEDVLNMEDIKNIPAIYFIVLNQNQKNYGFDVRSLDHWWNIQKQSFEKIEYKNPFTMTSFDDSQITLFMEKKNYIQNKLFKSILPKEQEEESKKEKTTDELIFNTFYQIQQLDFYNEGATWLKKLTINKLYDLFSQLEDLWAYRCQLGIEKKLQMVHGGKLFTTPIHYLRKITDIEKVKRIIFIDCHRLVTEGKTRDDRKLGAMYVLICLTLVSSDASKELPHFANLATI